MHGWGQDLNRAVDRLIITIDGNIEEMEKSERFCTEAIDTIDSRLGD